MLRRPGRLVAAATVVASLAAPVAAQATIPASVSKANWNLRHSWVDYLVNPMLSAGQGRVTPTGATPADRPVADPNGGSASGPPVTPYGYLWAKQSDTTTGGVRTLTLKGGIDFDQPLHGIDISLKALKLTPSGTSETIKLDATYRTTAGATVAKPGITFGTVGPTGVVTLSADGAEVFNGGANGAYSAGDAFGTLTYQP